MKKNILNIHTSIRDIEDKHIGDQTFMLKIDDEYFVHTEEHVIFDALQKIVNTLATNKKKYKVLNYTLEFRKPIVLDNHKFKKVFTESIEDNYMPHPSDKK